MKKTGNNRGRYADDAPLTAAELKTARPARMATPDVAAAFKRRRGRPEGALKSPVTIRIDKDLLKSLRALGPGWQTKVNDMLRQVVNFGRGRE